MHAHPEKLQERCAAIELLLLDLDGVLTDGGIIYDERGGELKKFHVRDGTGLKLWHKAGKRAALLSGRVSKPAEIRARELDIDPVIQGAPAKLSAYRQILAQTKLRPEQVCCLGDDILDLPLLRNCRLAVAVADADHEVRASAHFVTTAAGGRGAVRETIELILSCQGSWQPILERLRSETLGELPP
jgi:3-deoxy-D-manno-octulosonate 8-phosphate phosphatase (KDO 8-P phosphatase)